MTAGLVRMSHSRYELYSDCGERYRLEKIERIKRTPSIYAVAGRAFHTWSEDWDLDKGAQRLIEAHDWADRFTALVRQEEEKSGIELTRWDTPAYGKNANQKAFDKFRDELGPDMIQKYIEWRKESGWEIAQLPPLPGVGSEGRGFDVGVEYPVSYRVGSVSDIAVIDRIFWVADLGAVTGIESLNGVPGLIALDLKTWSAKRTTAQLPSYVVALRQVGIPVALAGYYEARKGEVSDLNSYDHWDEARLAALHEQAAHMIQARFFLPRVSDDCARICGVRNHCQWYMG